MCSGPATPPSYHTDRLFSVRYVIHSYIKCTAQYSNFSMFHNICRELHNKLESFFVPHSYLQACELKMAAAWRKGRTEAQASCITGRQVSLHCSAVSKAPSFTVAVCVIICTTGRQVSLHCSAVSKALSFTIAVCVIICTRGRQVLVHCNAMQSNLVH